MISRTVLKLAFDKRFLPLFIGLIVVSILIVYAPPIHAQSSTPEWQAAAGGKMEFDVASVRQNSPESPCRGDVDLDASNYFRYPGGLLTATGSLVNYIIFAYKIEDASQYPLLDAQLPKWARTAQFYFEARADGNPTKDQVRLMMQSLLADRFKLVVHTEPRQLPIYALVLEKPGITGSQLQPHPDDSLCTKMPDKSASTTHGSVPAPFCGLIFWHDNGQMHMRMMDFTMQQIAGNLATAGASMGGLDLDPRPILDKTGLSGRFDLNIRFLGVSNASRPPAVDSQPEEPGPTFVQALKNQAGLRLIKQTGRVDTYVIDHVETLSEN